MVQNPTLYIQIGSAKKIDIISLAEQTHPPGGAICLHLSEPMDKLIRAAKAGLQSAEISPISTRRVNIFVIVIAHDPQAARLTLSAGERLRALFAEDFAAFHITLAVLLDESNEADKDGYEYETRAAATYEFLASLTGDMAFNRVFLLSNRNEFGRVANHDFMHHMRQLLAFLPLLHGCENSRFDETLTAMAATVMTSGRKYSENLETVSQGLRQRNTTKAGRVLFASAGFGVGDLAVDVNKENRVLNLLAQMLEREMEGCDRGYCNDWAKSVSQPIAIDIASVASNPLLFSEILSLRGATLTEAEALIFGIAAENFFNKNYPQPLCDISLQNTLPLRDAIAEESHLAKLLEDMGREISKLTCDLSQKERTPVGFFQAIDNAKTAIGEAYAIKYKLSVLRTHYEKYQSRHTQLYSYIQYMRGVIAAIKALPTDLPPQTPPELLLSQAHERAALNISLLRHDGMLQESHIFGEPNNPCVLRLIGGFTLEDMVRYHTMRTAVPL